MNVPAVIASKPFYVRVALLGLGLYLGVVAAFLIVSLAISSGDDLVFSVIAGVPGLIAFMLALLVRPWSFVVSGILALAGILAFGPGVQVGLTTPDSFLDFMSATAGVGGLIIAFVGCVVSFFQARSGQASASGPPLAVLALRGLVAIMLIAGAISAVLTFASKETVSAAEREGAIVITASKTKWSTDRIDSSSTGTLKLLVKNSDPYLHTFTVKDLNMDFRIGPGSEKLIVLKTPKAGSHEFICNIHTDMKGTIQVR